MADEHHEPLACTLGPDDLRERLDRIRRLSLGLRARRRLGRRLELTYDADAADEIRELVRLEQACCPFLKFEINEGEQATVLVIEAPDHAQAGVDALFEPWQPEVARARRG